MALGGYSCKGMQVLGETIYALQVEFWQFNITGTKKKACPFPTTSHNLY